MIRSTLLAAVGACALIASVAPANAKIVSVVYSGTVDSGFDQSGLFGQSQFDLTGQSFTAELLFDTSKGETYDLSEKGNVYSQLSGDNYNGTSSPGLGASITILGIKYKMGGSIASTLATNSNLNFKYGHESAAQTEYVDDKSYPRTNQISFDVSAFVIANDSPLPIRFDAPFDGDVLGNVSYFRSTTTDLANDDAPFDDVIANLSTEHLTVTILPEVGTVPEPATWWMMILGFAAAGRAMRLRRGSDQKLGARLE